MMRRNIGRVGYAWFSEQTMMKKIGQASNLLPHQGILEAFVHRNPLQHFEDREFQEALEVAQDLESYPSPGLRALERLNVDPRRHAAEAMVELCSSFLDRGAAKWAAPFRDRGFTFFFASLEGLGPARWRSHARSEARKLLTAFAARPGEEAAIAADVLADNLTAFGIGEDEWEAALRVLMLELRGWAGMFHAMATYPE